MSDMQVFTIINSFAYIGFGLTDSFFKSVVAGCKGGDGGRKRTSRTMKVATLYFLLFEQADTTVVVLCRRISDRPSPVRRNDSGLPAHERRVSFPPGP